MVRRDGRVGRHLVTNSSLRLCVLSLRICVKSVIASGRIGSRKGTKPVKTTDRASRIKESNNEYENLDSHNFNHIREHAGTRAEQQSEHEFNDAHAHRGVQAYADTESDYVGRDWGFYKSIKNAETQAQLNTQRIFNHRGWRL